MGSRYNTQSVKEATTVDAKSDDGKEADLKSKTMSSRFSLRFSLACVLVVCGLVAAAAICFDFKFLICTHYDYKLGQKLNEQDDDEYYFGPWYGFLCPLLENLMDYWVFLLFVAVFGGLPTFLMVVVVVKYVLKVEHRDYSDFDAIVREVARMVMLPDKAGTESPLETPLLLESPPSSRTYRVRNKPRSILHGKSGKVLLSGSSALCDLRLIFTESGPEGFSIQGSTVFENGTTTFVIQEGFFSMVGLKIYWEESSSDGLRRVVTGTFQDDFASFSGEWCASDGTRGALAMI